MLILGFSKRSLYEKHLWVCFHPASSRRDLWEGQHCSGSLMGWKMVKEWPRNVKCVQGWLGAPISFLQGPRAFLVVSIDLNATCALPPKNYWTYRLSAVWPEYKINLTTEQVSFLKKILCKLEALVLLWWPLPDTLAAIQHKPRTIVCNNDNCMVVLCFLNQIYHIQYWQVQNSSFSTS